MAQRQIKTLDKIKGITFEGSSQDRSAVLKTLKTSVLAAAELIDKGGTSPEQSPIAIAASAALQSVTALVAAVGAKCNLAAPAEEIEAMVSENGDLVYRCHHRPPHEWNLNGKKLP